MKLTYNVKDKPKFGQILVFALQQLLAILAATIAVPSIIGNGMSQSAALFGAGVGTLVYLLFTKFRSPVFLGSSFAFLGSMATAFAGAVSMEAGYAGLIIGAVIAGLVYVVIAIAVKFCGVNWINKLMPPVVIGPTVAIIGLGGVGAYAAEMLARAGVGTLIIIDNDTVSVSNKNRQLLALDSTLGKDKTDVMKSRLLDINPELGVIAVKSYLEPDNVAAVLSQYRIDFLVDAIDTLAPKLALINYCVINSIPLVSSMGSGAKYDITKVKITDISKSFNCPLAYIVRKRLRREYGISKGFQVVFSEELPDDKAIIAEEGRNKKSNVGTVSYLPAVFGCACAQAALTTLLQP